MTYTSYEELIKDTALADEKYIVMTAENRAIIRSLPPILKERFIDTGITEQTMVGVAAGLALRGRTPILHALATFLTLRPFEFVRTDVGIGNLPVKLSSFIPGFLSEANGPTHQAVEDISLMRGIPNMQVFSPASNEDMLAMLPTIWASEHPSYVRINTRPGTYKHDTDFKIGKAEIVSKGTDITFLVHGMLFDNVYAAKQILEKQGLSVGLINMRSLKPVDEEAILDAAKNCKKLVTVEDHFKTGGLYSIVGETFLKHQVMADVQSLALDERWFRPALLAAVLEYEGFTPEKIAERVNIMATAG